MRLGRGLPGGTRDGSCERLGWDEGTSAGTVPNLAGAALHQAARLDAKGS
jgi:hypothetical protein